MEEDQIIREMEIPLVARMDRMTKEMSEGLYLTGATRVIDRD